MRSRPADFSPFTSTQGNNNKGLFPLVPSGHSEMARTVKDFLGAHLPYSCRCPRPELGCWDRLGYTYGQYSTIRCRRGALVLVGQGRQMQGEKICKGTIKDSDRAIFGSECEFSALFSFFSPGRRALGCRTSSKTTHPPEHQDRSTPATTEFYPNLAYWIGSSESPLKRHPTSQYITPAL